MQCPRVGCVGKVEKGMATIGILGDTRCRYWDCGCGWRVGSKRALLMAEKEDSKDVKIVSPDPPAENHNQKMILVLGSSTRAGDTRLHLQLHHYRINCPGL
ncbi:hypothetical protein BRADI_3g19589v3 [Brachypodium distachyon]|uniref:Uncharacterized protein n=1 Tax=Brachypodium distachyon TaxID=15368 RepID=A0A0Q3FCG4_BRADI|nr:hypothetical protein BRADI_3g19589v3 [Brachypodium distachyon]